MLKKKKTTASGKLVLVKSVRRHWTSGGCPLSADRSGTETAQPQNEILCSKGLGGRCPGQASGEENHKGIFFSAGLCVLTQALLAPFASLHGCMRCCPLSVRYFFSISSCKSRLTWV